MTEEEAYRHIQKCSMDSGTNNEKAAPRPNRRTGGFRREKTALSGLEGGARDRKSVV